MVITSSLDSTPVVNIVNNKIITLSNGVVVCLPLNLHAAWARAAQAKLGLAMLGISLIDIIVTICLKDISSICPDYIMPTVNLPSTVLVLDVTIDVLKEAYKSYAEIYCNIPISEWKTIKSEIIPYLDLSNL